MAFNVLIVDDSAAMRNFVRRVLTLSGIELGDCFEASNGQEALSCVSKNWVDVILTDINMPQMNGEEFVRRLSEDEILRAIPVIVVSTDGTDMRMQQMLRLGAKAYVKKPFLPETLRGKLDQVLS
jgi:two-component system chemotaxis response regulator CheY